MFFTATLEMLLAILFFLFILWVLGEIFQILPLALDWVSKKGKWTKVITLLVTTQVLVWILATIGMEGLAAAMGVLGLMGIAVIITR